ncbi:hypothetical protein [Aneurinibacillus danicus]|jgi:hypothetical protein|uniref:Uncharacterized protein n=1 Tax=Aneurinibacillus danicus TaxID=267746 RepID=A0A511VCE9_9BACL|nr:hypothetical protein [Aneurinibacillus danicus]GEN36587.1 hypothetical protein ADA01nite_40470 [Aneurinibacillus danicus]
MTYWEWIDDIFIEHHNCMGMDMNEVEEIMQDSTPEQRKKWLDKPGYDVSTDDYKNAF